MTAQTTTPTASHSSSAHVDPAAQVADAGFVPVQASSFAEAQAESLLKKVPVRGFRVEKRAGSLVLHWQRGELVSVSAWRC